VEIEYSPARCLCLAPALRAQGIPLKSHDDPFKRRLGFLAAGNTHFIPLQAVSGTRGVLPPEVRVKLQTPAGRQELLEG